MTAGEGPMQEPSPLVADGPESGRTVALLNGRKLSDIIAMKGPVKASLNEWLTWLRPNLITAWENYQYMRYLMWPEYEKAGLPEARSEEHTSELQSLIRISYAVLCLKKKNSTHN